MYSIEVDEHLHSILIPYVIHPDQIKVIWPACCRAETRRNDLNTPKSKSYTFDDVHLNNVLRFISMKKSELDN